MWCFCCLRNRCLCWRLKANILSSWLSVWHPCPPNAIMFIFQVLLRVPRQINFYVLMIRWVQKYFENDQESQNKWKFCQCCVMWHCNSHRYKRRREKWNENKRNVFLLKSSWHTKPDQHARSQMKIRIIKRKQCWMFLRTKS